MFYRNLQYIDFILAYSLQKSRNGAFLIQPFCASQLLAIKVDYPY